MKRLIKVVAAILISVFICAQVSTQVHADDILKIAGLTELAAKCYPGVIKPSVGNVTAGLKIADIFMADSDGKVKIPNLYQNTISDYDLKCTELVNGYTSVTGSEKYPALIDGNTKTLKEAEAIAFLKKMGYESSGAGSDSSSGMTKNHVSFVYEKTDWTNQKSNVKTHQIFISDIKDGKMTSSSLISTVNNGDADIVKYQVVGGKKIEIYCDPLNFGNQRGGCSDISISEGDSWDAFVEQVYKQLKDHRAKFTRDMGSYNFPKQNTYVLLKYDKQSGAESGADQGDNGNEVDGDWSFIGNSVTKAANAAVKANSSFSKASDLKFTSDQKATLHQHYFTNFFKGKLICEGDSGFDSVPSTAVKAESIKSKNCFAQAGFRATEEVHAIKPDLTWYVDYTFEKLVKNMTEDELMGAATADPGAEDPGQEGEDSKPSCTTNAHELGWIICPIVTGVSSFLKEFYQDWIEPFLNIDVGLFTFGEGDAGSNVYQVWTTFQGFANLAFVLVFLVVIFSQLTGVGIDNYGIKKILPKLIVTAILINLSYVICMVAVELSNIIGLAIKGLFSSMAPDASGIKIRVNPKTPSSEDIPAFGINLAVIGIVAGLTIPYALSVGWAIIVPALILVLSVLLSLFFLFAMLGIRQALVIILVCISPLAFVCYMLPNTKKLFDKWFSVFKAMLLAFPICSALVYGGDLVAKILVVSNQDSSNFISSVGILFTAAIVSIAPVFMIPGMIRKGLDVAGGIGAKLSGVHSKAKTATDSRVRNTGFAKDLEARRNNIQQFKDARRQRRKAGLKEDGTLSKRGELQNKFANSRIGKHFKSSNAALAARRQAGLSHVAGNMNNQRMLTAAGVAAAGASVINKQRETEIDDEITNMAKSTNNYNNDTMEQQLAALMAQQTMTAEDETRAKALMKKLSQAGGDGNKRLINVMNNARTSQNSRMMFSDYATSSGIANTIGNKDAYMAQYLRDLQSGASGTTANMTFDQWLGSGTRQIDDGSGNNVTVSNAEFVAKKVLDNDETLVGQSSTSFRRTAEIDNGVTIGGNGKAITAAIAAGQSATRAVSKDRAARMERNDNLNKTEEQVKILQGVRA